MDYASNGNLNAYLNRQERPLAWSAKRRLCVDVARGLEFLHSRAPHAVVHGDLKVRVMTSSNNRVFGFDGSSVTFVSRVD